MTKRELSISLENLKSGSKSQVYVLNDNGDIVPIQKVVLGVTNGLYSPILITGKPVSFKKLTIPES